MTLLEDAAAEARKVTAWADSRRRFAADLRDAKVGEEGITPIEREAAEKSLEAARVLAALAAIEKGLPPGCCHGAPATGQETP